MAEHDPAYRFDVFISYSHRDQEWVRQWLVPKLEAAGLKVAIDYRDFEVGLPSMVNMERAVASSRHTVLVLTPAWVESEYTAFEALLVQTDDPAGLQRRLLPLMLKPCVPPRRISILTYAAFTEKQRWNDELPRLVAAIRDEATLPQRQPPPPPPPAWPRIAGGAGALVAVALLLWFLLPPDEDFRVVSVIPGGTVFSVLPAPGDAPVTNYALYLYHRNDTFRVDTLRQGIVFAGAGRDLRRAFERTDSVLYAGLEAYLQGGPEASRESVLAWYKKYPQRLPTAPFEAGDAITVVLVRSPDDTISTRHGTVSASEEVTSIILEKDP